MRLTLTLLIIFCCTIFKAQAYSFSGVSGSYTFGAVASPFPDLSLLETAICVGYTALVESANYKVQATSSTNPSGAFQLSNTANSSYKLNYTVSWAGSSGGTPTFTPLVSGQSSSVTFPAQLLGGLTCLVLPANASLQLQLLGADQMLAKEGSYTDTLTILIVAG